MLTLTGKEKMSFNKEKFGPLFIFLSAFLWSLAGIFTKSVAWDGVCLATLRGVLAFIAAGCLLRWRKVQLNRVKVLCALCYFAQGVLFMCANKFTTAGNAAVLQNMSPLYIILMNAVISKKPPKKNEILVCVILFIGIGLAFAGQLGGGAALGNILAMLSALFYAGVFFLSKQENAEPIESLFLGNACYLFLVPILVTNQTVLHTNLHDWIFILFFGFISGFGAWYCFSIGIKYATALQASFIALAEPVMAPIWTYLFLHEKISTLSLIGFIIVIGTLIVYNIDAARHASHESKAAA